MNQPAAREILGRMAQANGRMFARAQQANDVDALELHCHIMRELIMQMSEALLKMEQEQLTKDLEASIKLIAERGAFGKEIS